MVRIAEKTALETARIITSYDRGTFVAAMDSRDQHNLKVALISSLCANHLELGSEEFEEAYENGMNSRLCDLEDTISITYIK